MTGIRYPNSSDWLTYDYDKMGRLTAIPGFAGTKSKPGFTYDENSALQSVKTDNGIETSYQRDNNGRITNINAAKSGASILGLTYAYDAANNIIQRNDNIYIYDKINRLQRATIYGAFEDKFTKADLLMGTADQDYHGEKEAEEDVTDQTQIKLDFSARSLILDLQTEADNISKVELIPEVTGHRVPVEQIEIYYRNGFAFNKLARDKWVGTKEANGRIIIKFAPLLETGEMKIHCNYDDLDLWQRPLIDRSEFYNNPEKLVTVYQKFAARTESYEYDAMGNRTVERILLREEYGWNYIYYPDSNRLQSKVKQDGTERIDYAYDENGNLISKVVTKGDKIDTWEYSYDLMNQLEQVKKNGNVISSYIYDPNGFRVEKNGSKGKIHYVPLLNGEVGYRKEFSSNKEYSFIYVGIQHLARVNGVIGGSGKKFYYHNDHLGSALAVTDEYGNKVVERDFTPFGERINTDVYDDEPRDLDEDESGFTGKDWDIDAGLYYYNARWYDPAVGRFISEDSVADDPNLYGYCGGNPVNFTDPTGHFSVGIQKGYGLFSASVNAVGLLTKNYDLCTAMSTLSLFVAVHGSWDRIVDTVKGLFGGNKYTRYGSDIRNRYQGYIKFEGKIREALNDPEVLHDVIESINDRGLGKEEIQKVQRSNNVTNSKNKDEDEDQKKKGSETAEAREAFNRWLDSNPQLRFGMEDGIMFPEEFFRQLLFEAVYHNVDLSKLSILELDQIYMIEFGYMYPKYLRYETAARMLAIDPKNAIITLNSLQETGLNFTKTTATRMADPARKVSITTLKQVIKNTRAFKDPQGSSAVAHYGRVVIRGKTYNIKVIYDEATNTVYHFHYTTKAIDGIIGPISK